MNRALGALVLLSAICCYLAANAKLLRAKRGTRSSRARCVDSQTSAVRSQGDTWLRWRGQRVEYCSCTRRGERCHYVPVVNTSEKCVVGRGGGYRGTWSITKSGAECINWNASSLREKKFTARKSDANSLGLGNHNFCRNPDNDATPWCYVYKGARLDWEHCSLPRCTEDKYRECTQGSGQEYLGTKAVTKSGSRCLPWDSPFIRHKLYNAWRPDALKLGLGSHSFCRNPDNDAGPWCFTYRSFKLTWELCDITKCSRRPATMTSLGPRGPIGNDLGTASCGQRSDNSLSQPSFRIFGGRGSDITEQPWQAAINVYKPRYRQHFHRCGGILIDSCWVLSAAHCFEEWFSTQSDIAQLQVVLGRTFRKKNSTTEQVFNIEKLLIHEKFDEKTFDNDIALLKLKTNIGMCAVNAPEVFPACLPERGLVLPDWTECEISGYGRQNEFSAEYSERVKRGYVRLWPQERCVPEVLSERTITANMLCAGDTRGLDDACKGDSGGPLVCPNNGRMTLMGVISWGDGCGQRDKPGVYTRVTNYIDWITSKVEANPVF
ncbi:salivary plasminogen activator gamma isoform X2 [Lampris incognitus]|uniref:salivary plasminogen activator gamma isoform X2 n=1 Tax=Lampris incognitus TaxID=2546036 RepID=UPI0024B4E38A|nr:salivary plasminogen activator gamma isoform X2 [Lampris incognitus]